MKQTKRNSAWHFAVFVAFPWFLPSAQVASAETQIAIAHKVVSPDVLPVWIAHEQGIFKKHKVEARIFLQVGSGVDHLFSGETQFSYHGIPATTLHVVQRKDLKILAAFHDGRLSSLLVTRPEIKKPEQLRGKRFGVFGIGTGFWIQAMLALEQLGLEPKRDAISFKAVGNQLKMVQALEAGEIDAVMLDPAQAGQLRTKGYVVLLDMYPANVSASQNALTVTGAYVQEHPEVVEQVLTALLEGMAFSLAPSNKRIVLSTLMKHMQITDPAAAESGYESFLRNVNRKPYPSLERMRDMQRVMALHEPKVLNLRLEAMIEDRFVRKLDESGVIDRLYSTYGVR